MEHPETSNLLFGSFWHGWRRWLAWLLALGLIILLGGVRSATDAEFGFASLALLPVVLITWLGGLRNGLMMGLIAAAMWLLGDLLADRRFSAWWIPWANAATQLLIYSLVAKLTTLVRCRFEKEHEGAMTDPLTELPNRRAFLTVGEREIERSARYHHPLAVIFLDLDDFKHLNDCRGHQVGDQALQSVASAIRGALRASDLVARLGGDEFAILLPETGFSAAVETSRKIVESVRNALQAFPPTDVSMGLAWFTEADRAFPEMLEAADTLMYQAKQDGKGAMKTEDLSGKVQVHKTEG